MKKLFGLTLLLGLMACGGAKKGDIAFDQDVFEPEYATGFSIKQAPGDDSGSKLFTTLSPWQGNSNVSTQFLMLDTDCAIPSDYNGQILRGEAKRIVCMSSTHVAMLDRIGEADRIVGISGKNYISTPSIVDRLDEIAEVGYEGNIDYEQLVAVRPDLVMLYGVNGASSMEPKLKELGIPFVYIGDYTEQSPLGKAEWMRFVAEITGSQDVAKAEFEKEAEKYNKIKEKFSLLKCDYPDVMLNIPYGDVWYMPGPESYMAQLIEDAGGEYIYKDGKGSDSTPIDFETAYQLVEECDIWLNVGQVNSIDELIAAVPKLKDAPVIKNRMVFNNNACTNAKGGNAFWETGITNPSKILDDLTSIIYNECDINNVSGYSYYKRLE